MDHNDKLPFIMEYIRQQSFCVESQPLPAYLTPSIEAVEKTRKKLAHSMKRKSASPKFNIHTFVYCRKRRVSSGVAKKTGVSSRRKTKSKEEIDTGNLYKLFGLKDSAAASPVRPAKKKKSLPSKVMQVN